MTPEEERMYNAIDAVVYRMYRNRSPEEMVSRVRQTFPSPVPLIESSPHAISLSGLSRINGMYFSLIPELSRRSQRAAFGTRPKLDKLSLMCQYLRTLFIGIHVEQFYVVMLSATGLLIRTVMVGSGIENATLFDMKRALSLMVACDARAVVLCHNHPGGTLQPSQEDISCTLRMLNATMAIHAPMLDHIIIAHKRAVSMRDSGYIPSELWTKQAPKNRLLRDWIDIDPLCDE